MGLLRKLFQKKATVQEQLEVFAKHGIHLNEDVQIEDLAAEHPDGLKTFEDDPYDLLYFELGNDTHKKPWRPITNQLWTFDSEAIEGNGSYVTILKNIARITNGILNFENVHDLVDFDNEVVWVSFMINGEQHKLDLMLDDDWVDPLIFKWIVEYNNRIGASKALSCWTDGGQSCVFLYVSQEELNALKKETNLDIEWFIPGKQINQH